MTGGGDSSLGATGAMRALIERRARGITPADETRKAGLESRYPGTAITHHEIDRVGVWQGHVPLPGGTELFKARYDWDGGLPQLLDDLEAAIAEARPDG